MVWSPTRWAGAHVCWLAQHTEGVGGWGGGGGSSSTEHQMVFGVTRHVMLSGKAVAQYAAVLLMQSRMDSMV